MANSILTADVVAREMLDILKNKLQLGNKVYRAYESEWAGDVNGFKKGDTVRIKKPARFIAKNVTDITSSIQDFDEPNTTLAVDQRRNVSWNFSSEELTLDISQYRKRVLEPAMRPLVEEIDAYIAGLYYQMYNYIGTSGNEPSTFDDLLAIQERFDNLSAPAEDRCAFFNPAARRSLVNNLKGVFQPPMVESWLKKAAIGSLADVDHFTSTFIVNHTAGTNTSTTGAVNDGAIAAGDTSIVTNGWTASKTLKKGDVFTFADVYAVDYVTKAVKDYLQPFRLTADVSTDGSGNATLAFDPPLNSTANGKQNISALPANAAVITILSGVNSAKTAQHIAFTEQSIALACVPLTMPDSVVWGARETSEQGLSIRIVKDYAVLTDKEIVRADILFGAKVIYPETCMRVRGQ